MMNQQNNENEDRLLDDEISSILLRVSTKTTRMKTNNLILFNKVNNEINNMMQQAQEIVKFCLTDRNEFVKEVESIQSDFAELNERLELKKQLQLNRNNNNIKTISSNNLNESELRKQSSHLLGLFDEESDDEGGGGGGERMDLTNQLKKLSQQRFELEMPETMTTSANDDDDYFDRRHRNMQSKNVFRIGTMANRISNANGFTIRETIDSEDNNYNANLVNHAAFNPRFSKKEKSTDSVSSAASASTVATTSTKTPKKATPKKNTSINIKTPNKTIDKFFKKVDSSPVLKTMTASSSDYNNHAAASTSSKTNQQSHSSSKKSKFSAAVSRSSESVSINRLQQQQQQQDRQNENVAPQQPIVAAKNAIKTSASQFNSVFRINRDDDIHRNRNNQYDFEETLVDDHQQALMTTNEQEAVRNNQHDSLLLQNVKEEYLDVENPRSCEKSSPVSKKFRDESNGSSGGNKNEDNNEDELIRDFFKDFDKGPKKKTNSPTYKHVEVVRNQEKRKKLLASSCKECENYWNSLPEDKRPKRMEESCRHRSKYRAPNTPEHFWSVEFPTTQECIERGYGGVQVQNDLNDSLGTKRPRRKRPLHIITNKQTKSSANDDENLDFGE